MLNILPHDHPHARRPATRSPSRPAAAGPWWVWAIVVVGSGAILYVGASAAVFFAVRWHLTDTPGIVDPQADAFNQLAASTETLPSLPSVPDRDVAEQQAAHRLQACRLDVLARVAPRNAALIQTAAEAGVDATTVTKMIFAASLRLPSGSPATTAIDSCANSNYAPGAIAQLTTASLFPWGNAEEWGVVQEAFRKDRPVIDRVSQEIGVPSRLLVAVAMVEQLRLYYTQREAFEKFFRPLKILGNATQFAWGVMAIKEKTAIDIERLAKSPTSAFYPGPASAKILALPADQPEKERFSRLTNEKNHYYSYVYGATELKEFMAQWRHAGWPIDDRPEILATLFNIGFGRSHPSANPQVGGSVITIANTEYTFGALAFEFYYSGELATEFPFQIASAQ